MLNISQCNKYGDELIAAIKLRFSPIAFKLINHEDEIPANSTRPFRDEGNRLTMCQAFSLARRNRRAITMLSDDHWCLWPLACFKQCPVDDEDYETMGTKLFMKDAQKSVNFFKESYPWLDTETPPLGFAVAPLESCEFIPDVVVIYCKVSQLRTLIMSVKFEESALFDVVPDTIVSCCYATIPLLNGQNYNVTIPDPGEYERSLADEDEIIFSLRGDRLETLMQGIGALNERGFGYAGLKYDMNYNFPRAPFYNEMFAKWNLAPGEDWNPGNR
jgi:uncharacterized protein (DUF169 family)